MWFLVLGFPAGIIAGVLFSAENSDFSSFLLLVVACSALGFARTKTSGQGHRVLTLVFLLLTAGAGWQWGALSSDKLALWSLETEPYFLTGEVVGVPANTFYGQRLKVRLECLGTKPGRCNQYRSPWWQRLWGQAVYAHINLPKETNILPGTHVRFGVRFSRIETTSNPAQFDVHRWLRTHHVVAQFVLAEGVGPELLSQSWFSVDRFRLRVSGYLKQKRDSEPRTELSAYAVILALVTGDRSLMSDAHWDVFNRTGTSHLVAISGLHIGLVAAFIVWCTLPFFRRWQWFTDRYPASHGSIVLALMAALVYAAVAGFAFPVQRAVIMLSVFVGLKLLGRVQQRWFALALAFCLVLTWDPVACISLGFWLSFVAVYLIIWVVGGSAIMPSRTQVWIKVQIGLLIGLAPILLWQVQATSLVSMFTNLVAVPLVGFLVVPLALLWAVSWSCLGSTADAVLVLLAQSVDTMVWVLEYAAGWEWSVWAVGGQHWASMLLAMAGVLWLCSAGVPGRLWGLILLAPVFLTQSQGSALTILQAKELQMAIQLQGRIVFVSGSHWPHMMPRWHEELLRHWGVQVPATVLPVKKGADLWGAKGLVATEYHLEQNWLGQPVIDKVAYQDLCQSPDSFRYGVLTISTLVTVEYPQYCVLQWDVDGQAGLYWPASPQRFQNVMLGPGHKLNELPGLLVLETDAGLKIDKRVGQIPANNSQIVLLGDTDINAIESSWLLKKLDRGQVHNLNQNGFFYTALRK